jgi:hypothetical protein
MKMPKVLPSAFQNASSWISFSKLARPAQPVRVGSSSRQLRSATMPLKTIGNNPKIAKSRKNGEINRYGTRLLSKRWSQLRCLGADSEARRCAGSGFAVGGALRVRDTATPSREQRGGHPGRPAVVSL